MEYWSTAPEPRARLVLFPTRLDDAIGSHHPVRLLDEILGRLDWSAFESDYHGSRGQPPIHPRILAGVTLYGLMTRIRSSRSLEQSLQVRLDFRWLAEGRSIDHTTLSEFRRKQGEPLKNLFMQVGLVARQLGLLPLEQLTYDGTRLRANHRRTQNGLIVACDVIAMTNEEHFLKSQIEQVQQDYGLSAPPPEMLADGMMSRKRFGMVYVALS
jgi:transposase